MRLLAALLLTVPYALLLAYGVWHDVEFPKLNGWTYEQNLTASVVACLAVFSLAYYGWKHRPRWTWWC